MILGENLWASLSWLGLILATGLLLFLLLGGLLTYTSLLRNTLPPVAGVPNELGWPILGCVGFLANPKRYLQSMRDKHGDAFVLRVLGFKLFFVFSNSLLRTFYGFSEADASFTEATRTLLGFKLPPALLAGDMAMFSSIFKTELMRKYARMADRLMQTEIQALGESGRFEVFAFMKRLVHKIGFLSWAGPESIRSPYFQRLAKNFDVLDPETTFKDIRSLATTILTNKLQEIEALNDIILVLKQIWEARQEKHIVESDTLDYLHELYAELPPDERFRRVGIDVVILHVASQANLYAAMSWFLIHILQHPSQYQEVSQAVRALQDEYNQQAAGELEALNGLVIVEQCAQESIRLTQQSITLRKVINPVTFPEIGVTVPPGYFIATLLSVTNCRPEFLGNDPNPAQYCPVRYNRPGSNPAARCAIDFTQHPDATHSVSTFGHGRHACVGERFALSIVKIFAINFLTSFDFTPQFGSNVPILETQIGAVGRAAIPCEVTYQRRH